MVMAVSAFGAEKEDFLRLQIAEKNGNACMCFLYQL